MRVCRNCGARAEHSHHAIPRSLCAAGVTERLNLLALCPDCHGGWHDRSVVIYRDVFLKEELAWIAEHSSEGWLKHWYPERPEGFGVF